MKILRIALVEYINTRPFLDGLEQEFHGHEIELQLLPPSQCAVALREGRCDLALIPVGSLIDFQQVEILPNYCIGARGAVDSVFIFSELPIEELDCLQLDPHSRSSNALAQILLKHHWHRELPLLQPARRNFDNIKGTTGGVVIGDVAIRMRERFTYHYDLAEAWQQMTGLPFAFAVWVARPGALDAYWRKRLNQAFAWGVRQAPQSAQKWATHFELKPDFAHHYLTHSIQFEFDAPKHRALAMYLRLLQHLAVKEVALAEAEKA
jgi:chorismate dehydratase